MPNLSNWEILDLIRRLKSTQNKPCCGFFFCEHTVLPCPRQPPASQFTSLGIAFTSTPSSGVASERPSWRIWNGEKRQKPYECVSGHSRQTWASGKDEVLVVIPSVLLQITLNVKGKYNWHLFLGSMTL